MLEQKPTDAELEILQILWQNGPNTVRFVHDEIAKTKATGYTTTLKNMQNMVQKNLLSRDESQRSHIYHPLVRQKDTQQILLDKLMDNVFGGSAGKLVMQALGNKKTSRKELAQIKALIDKLEGGQHD